MKTKSSQKRLTFDDLLNQGKSEKFGESVSKKGVRVLRNRKEINPKGPTEMYLNESELKKAAVDMLLIFLKNCMILKTDNMPLIVRGRRTKTRNPGMADQHICIRGMFVAIEAKMPDKDLDLDQIKYKKKVLASQGIHITYHSVFELETELLKYKLISRRMLK